ncbi:MAG: anhydro-N-acetylmuramic acid kinase [Magnetococcales bacterium]|nr:anhydro-N-acetylmuramic acid kinase [Magnetococcales bacterium]
MNAPFLCVGLMSGTSADGIDAALVATDGTDRPRLLASLTHPLPEALKTEALAMLQPGDGEIDRLGELDRELGECFAAAALAVCRHAGREPKEVDCIGSHGQTIRHRPPRFTLQIASPSIIARRTGLTTVADFRPADVAAGGDGAPLTPLFHRVLFADEGTCLAVVNLGGIGNVTILRGHEDPRVAGDTGPANTLLDLLAQRESGGQAHCDKDGALAAQGVVSPAGLASLLADGYFARPFPKSTGREHFGAAYLEAFLGNFPDLSVVDRFATLTAFTAETVAKACRELAPPCPDKVVLCGGGARNPTLRRHLGERLACPVLSSEEVGVDPDSLEAQAFAWFAVRTLRGLPSSLPGATGAGHPAVLGAIHPGENWRELLGRLKNAF